MPLPVSLIKLPSPKLHNLVDVIVDELGHKDIWLMVLGSALMSVAYLLRSEARENIYWRIND